MLEYDCSERNNVEPTMNHKTKRPPVYLVLLLISSMVLNVSCSQPKLPTPQEFPSDWKLDEILGALIIADSAEYAGLSHYNAKADLLIWKIEEDDRPWYVERCILWVRYLERVGRERWILAHLVRSPKPPPQG